MLHRNDNANLVRRSYCGQYRKRLPDRPQRRAFGHHLPFAEEHGRSMARHHLRRVGSAPSYTGSGEVEAVLGQYG
jgi:hypothetical protein